MILLESETQILLNKENLESGRDFHFSDFSDSQFHLVNQENGQSRLSLRIPAWKALDPRLQRQVAKEYEGLWEEHSQQSSEYDVTICFGSNDSQAVKQAANLRAAILAAPLRAVINSSDSEENSLVHRIPLTADDGESMTVAQIRSKNPSDERQIIVMFSTKFHDPTDNLLARVFLQEFFDTRHHQGNSLNDAPTILFGKEPPKELSAHVKGSSSSLNYITFVLFPRHFATPQAQSRLLALLPTFRDYLHYHLKCTKAFLHQRMRAKTGEFQKILNRAKPENLKD